MGFFFHFYIFLCNTLMFACLPDIKKMLFIAYISSLLVIYTCAFKPNTIRALYVICLIDFIKVQRIISVY